MKQPLKPLIFNKKFYLQVLNSKTAIIEHYKLFKVCSDLFRNLVLQLETGSRNMEHPTPPQEQVLLCVLWLCYAVQANEKADHPPAPSCDFLITLAG